MTIDDNQCDASSSSFECSKKCFVYVTRYYEINYNGRRLEKFQSKKFFFCCFFFRANHDSGEWVSECNKPPGSPVCSSLRLTLVLIFNSSQVWNLRLIVFDSHGEQNGQIQYENSHTRSTFLLSCILSSFAWMDGYFVKLLLNFSWLLFSVSSGFRRYTRKTMEDKFNNPRQLSISNSRCYVSLGVCIQQSGNSSHLISSPWAKHCSDIGWK